MAPLPKSKKSQPVDSDEERRLIAEKDKVDSLNKYRLKGSRNNNNPSIKLQNATEVIVIKQANYIDCLTCHFCIQDNQYGVYSVNDFNLGLFENNKMTMNKIIPTDDIRISQESAGGADDAQLKFAMLEDDLPVVPDTKGFNSLTPFNNLTPSLPAPAASTKVNEIDLTK